jgi:hypothetical protein
MTELEKTLLSPIRKRKRIAVVNIFFLGPFFVSSCSVATYVECSIEARCTVSITRLHCPDAAARVDAIALRLFSSLDQSFYTALQILIASGVLIEQALGAVTVTLRINGKPLIPDRQRI